MTEDNRGGTQVNIHEIKDHFQMIRKYEAEDVNELLDFVKKCYIHNEITVNDYFRLIYELESLGATSAKDDSTFVQTK